MDNLKLKKYQIVLLVIIGNIINLWLPFLIVKAIEFNPTEWYGFPYIVTWVVIIVAVAMYSVWYLDNN